MSLRIGLYYPYPRVRNANWLRIAALYWPKIARVKPVGWDVHSSELEDRLQEELDMFVEVSQEQAHLDTLKIITSLLEDNGDEIRDRYRVTPSAVTDIFGFSEGSVARDGHRFSQAPNAKLVTGRWPPPKFEGHPEQPQSGLVVIYLRDYTMPLAAELADQGLALLDDKRRIIAVPPNLAWAYSGLLSDKLAELNRLVPITDEDSVYASMSEWDASLAADRLLGHPSPATDRTGHSYESAIGMLAVEQVIPKDMSNLPIDKLIEIRKRYGVQFDAFHDLVNEISADLPEALNGITDPAVVEAYLKNVVGQRIASPRAELERAVRSLGIDTTLSATAVKVELLAMIGVAIGVPLATGNPIFATAGAAFAAYGLHRERAKQRASITRTSPVGYLWQIDRKLKPKPLLQRILNR
jgi:hypothetical protein